MNNLVKKKRMATLLIVLAIISANSPIRNIYATCHVFPAACDSCAGEVEETPCTATSTWSCSYLISDADVNCTPCTRAACYQNGTEIANVTTILMTGHCNGSGVCVIDSLTQGTTGPRCLKQSVPNCQLAKASEKQVHLYAGR